VQRLQLKEIVMTQIQHISLRRVSVALAALAFVAAALVALSTAGTARAEPCNGTYTHCETNQCSAAHFYRNYDPTADHFFDEYGAPLGQEQGDIRDEPYRRYGPRGVRGFHAGQWGFYSKTCFPG
jgi:hypothetical protein